MSKIEVKVLNAEGKSAKSLQLPADIFGVDMNEPVLHSVIKSYRANARQGTHATKTKGMVAGGGKKPFKQKGTGEARQGSSRSPLNPGGGVIHGPQPRCYREDTTQQLKQLALRIALSDKVRHGKLTVVTEIPLVKHSTKDVVTFLTKCQLNGPVTLSDERKDKLLAKSSRNIKYVDSILPSGLNAFNVLRRENLLITETALDALSKRLASKS